MTDGFDAVIIGGGHNGLTAAAYLAKSGRSVCVLERRNVVGGAAVTEEFHPGYRNSVYAYVVGLLSPRVIADLDLESHGLRIMTRTHYQNFHPLPDGAGFLFPRDRSSLSEILEERAPGDGKAYIAFEARLNELAPIIRRAMAAAPPDLHGGWRDALSLLQTGFGVRHLSPAAREDLVRLFTMSAADYLDFYFDDPGLKGVIGFDAVVGNFQSLHAPGSAYVLLHHVVGEVAGETGLWGQAVGGMGAITDALASAARALGAEIRCDAAVKSVIVEKGQAIGVRLESGEDVRGRASLGNVHPQRLYLDMVGDAHLPTDFVHALTKWRSASGSFRMNLALSELPRWHGLSGAGTEEVAIILCPSIEYTEQAFRDAQTSGWAREPVVHMVISSVLDDTLAPPGCHVASLFCQHFNPRLPDGRSWDDAKEQAADEIVSCLARYSPNLKGAMVARQIKTPLDIERDLGMIGGDIFHGALHLDQIYALRPAAGYADYRSPIVGLYLCGAGAHPGGGVTGLPGRNAAQAVLADI